MFRIPDADDREYLIVDAPELTHWERIVEVDKFSLSELKTDKTQADGDSEDSDDIQARKTKNQFMFMLYTYTKDKDIGDSPYGLLDFKYLKQIQKLENYIQNYDQSNSMFP